MWVPSCSVMSGPHTGKDAKATSTDSPPKGYGTPNLVGVTGHWLVSGILVSGLRAQVQVYRLSVVSRSWDTGHTHGGRPAGGQVGCRSESPASTISPARRAHGGHPMTPPLQD